MTPDQLDQLEPMGLPDNRDQWVRQAMWDCPGQLVSRVLVETLDSRVPPVYQVQPDPSVPVVLPVPSDLLALRVMLVRPELADYQAREDLRDPPAVREFKEIRVVLETLVQ